MATNKKKKKYNSFTDYTKDVLNLSDDDISPIVDKSNPKTYNQTVNAFATIGDISPVKASAKPSILDGWLKKSEGNKQEATLGTIADAGVTATKGFVGVGETLLDAFASVASGAHMNQQLNVKGYLTPEDWKNQEKMQKKSLEFVKKDLYDEKEVAKKILAGVGQGLSTYSSDPTGFTTMQDYERARQTGKDIKKFLDEDAERYSVMDEKLRGVVESAGQLGATSLLATAGIPWWVTTGVSSFGGEMENALNQGATEEEAIGSSLVNAFAEVLTEKLSGGISFGGKTLDDGLTNVLAKSISNKGLRALSKIGMDIAGEGTEEVISQFFSRLGSSLYKEEDLSEILFSEEAFDEYLTSAISGGILGGVASTGKAVKSAKTGTDVLTGYSKNEQAVFDKVVKNRIEELEQDGKKITNKEKSEVYEQAKKDFEEGNIDIDTIESVLGGETLKNYQSTVENEDAVLKEFTELNKMKQGEMTGEQIDRRTELKSQLEEIKNNSKRDELKKQLSKEVYDMTVNDSVIQRSYEETAKKGQDYTADLTKYTPEAQKTIQKAMDSGILNNSRKTHEFVDLVAKVSAEKGVSFDFMNNERIRESGFALKDKRVNGFVKSDGTVAINMESKKAFNTVVGHEITHVLEGSPDLYNAMAESIKGFADAKGIYQSMYDTAYEGYKDVYKGLSEEEYDKKIEKEVVADLVGDYIFTDIDFVRNLSTKNRNVFQKVYDEIKYFLKRVTTGSSSEKKLLEAKKLFEDVYRETAKTTENTEVETETPTETDVDNVEEQSEVQYSITDIAAIQEIHSIVDKDTSIVKENPYVKEALADIIREGRKIQKATTDKNTDRTLSNEQPQQKTVGLGVAKALATDGRIALVGKKLSGNTMERREQLATHSMVLRDPRFETFRQVYVKNGEIVATVSTTSMTTDASLTSTKSNEEEIKAIKRRMNSLGADGFYIMHNHPSGNPQPSRSDLIYTDFIKKNIDEFKGHIVIDHNKYAFIDEDITYGETAQSESNSVDFKKKVIDHPLLYKTITSTSDLANISVNLVHNKNISTVIYANAKAEILSIQEIDNRFLRSKDFSNFVANRKRDFGCANAFLVTGDKEALNNDDIRNAIERNIFTDVFDTIGNNSYRDNGIEPNDAFNSHGKLYRNMRGFRVKEDNKISPVHGGIEYTTRDTEGRQLTPMQSNYFKDSKARDENGNLKVVYHSSDRFGFTVFNSKMSDDKRSHFFTDVEGMAHTYVKDKGNTYKVYLNLKNPLIVDARGRNWNRIKYGEAKDELIYKVEKYLEYAQRFDESIDMSDLADSLEGSIIGATEYLLTEVEGDNDPLTPPLYSKSEKAELMELAEEIDEAYENWDESEHLDEDGEETSFNRYIRENQLKTYNTRKLSEKAQKDGYDGVIINNVRDNGKYTEGKHYMGSVYIAFDSNQIKSVTNQNPTSDEDIRYSVTQDTEGRQLSPEQSKYFKDSKVKDDNGYLKTVYHGSPAAFNEFSLKYLGTNGTAEGYGFYFTDKKHIAENYSHGTEAQGFKGADGKLFEVYLDIKKPLSDTEVTMKRSEFKKFLMELNKQVDEDGEPLDVLSNYGDVSWEGLNKVLGYAMEIEYDGSDSDVNMVHSIINGTGQMETVLKVLRDVTGYDGIIVDNPRWGDDQKIYLAFHPEQIKNVDNVNPTDNPDIRYSISDRNKSTVKDYRGFYSEDILLRKGESQFAEEDSIAPVANDINVGGKMAADDFVEDYAPLSEAEANVRDDRQIEEHYFPEDMPTEEPEEIYNGTYADHMKPADPFYEKDIFEVGKDRKQKAYMYENPEVKPFFQEEARYMLGELDNSSKGERFYNDQLYYDTNGEYGIFGTKRNTSEEIAYLLDTFNYTYKDIAKGLNAIIEDNGKENNAISKRIEFLLDERLRLGYKDFWFGDRVPPNQEYINLLNEKQVSEYNDEAFSNWVQNLSEEDIRYFTQREEEIASDTSEYVPENITPQTPEEILYSLEESQDSKLEEMDQKVDAVEEEDSPELSVDEQYSASVENYKTSIEGYNKSRAEIEKAFDDVIAKKQAEYDGLKRKDTQRASNLLMQMENLRLRKANNLSKFDKRIENTQQRLDKMIAEEDAVKERMYGKRRKEAHEGIVNNIKSYFTSKGFDLDTVLGNAKNLSTFSTVDNTPQRVMEKSLGYKEGQALADMTVNKVAQNESEGVRWVNGIVRELKQISKEYGIKPRSKESAAAQKFAEGYYIDENDQKRPYKEEELKAEFPDPLKRENIIKLASDPRIRKIYDDALDSINESRRKNHYKEVPKRANYFLHSMEKSDIFSRLGTPFNPQDIGAADLPTDINGMTADFKPGQPYFASANARKGYKTTYDLLGGVEKYVNAAKNQIYHIEDIQTLRALRNYIADMYGQAKGFEGLDEMSNVEVSERIKQIQSNHLSSFAKFLNEEANIIAGKTSLIDRGLEGIMGRRGIKVVETINRQVGSNMVGFNVSSALTNLISGVQAMAKSNKYDVLKAFTQTASNRIGSIYGKTDGFTEENSGYVRRHGIDKFSSRPVDKVNDAGYFLMGAVDSVTSEFILRTKYNELTRKGMSSEQAHIEADKWASRILGDRSIGQQPQLYNSKMLGLITKFQLEVRNQLDSQFYDTYQDAKTTSDNHLKTAAKVGSTVFQLAVLQHIFGTAFESVTGYNPAFDFIEALMTAIGADDDEESEDTALDNVEQGFLALLEDLPYTSTLTGGRIPIESALPIKELITGENDYGQEVSRVETLKEVAPYYVLPTGYGQIKKTSQGLGMFDEDLPISGSYTDSGNLRFPVEDTTKNRVQAGLFGQYASENAQDYFDNDYAPLKEKQIQEYIDVDIPIKDYRKYREGLTGLKTLNEKGDYIGSLDLPVAKKNILINNIADRETPIDYTGFENYKDFQEFDFANRRPDVYEVLKDQGISVKDYKENLEESVFMYTDDYSTIAKTPEKYAISKAISDDLTVYKQYTKDLSEFRSDYDSKGKAIKGREAKDKKMAYIESLPLDKGQKMILHRTLYNSASAKNEYNPAIIDYLNSRDDLSYEEVVTILEELEMTVHSDGRITW